MNEIFQLFPSLRNVGGSTPISLLVKDIYRVKYANDYKVCEIFHFDLVNGVHNVAPVVVLQKMLMF